MPRPRKSGNIEGRISDLVADHIQALVDALSAEIRHNVAEQIKNYMTGAGAGSGARAGRTLRLLPRKKRIRPCIAPNCKNMSKGPRFHYLCDQHKNAAKKDYDAWRLKAQERSAF